MRGFADVLLPVPRRLLRGLDALFFPWPCPLCGVDLHDRVGPGAPWHPDCFATLSPRTRLTVHARNVRAGAPVSALLDDSPAWFALLHRIKYGGESCWLEPLGRALTAAILAGGGLPEHSILVPVPDDPRRRRERGFSPVGRLCEALALDRPVRPDLLLRSVAAPSQTTLDDDRARARNAMGRLRTGDLATIPSRNSFVLVEDQVTSGATVRECVARLGARGHAVAVVALARAARAPERVHP